MHESFANFKHRIFQMTSYFKELAFTPAPIVESSDEKDSNNDKFGTDMSARETIEYKPLLDDTTAPGKEKTLSMKQQIVLGMMLLIAIFLTIFLGFYVQALKGKSDSAHGVHPSFGASHGHMAATSHSSHGPIRHAKAPLKLVCKCILLKHGAGSHIPLRTILRLTLKGDNMSTLHRQCHEECQKMKHDMLVSDRAMRKQDLLKKVHDKEMKEHEKEIREHEKERNHALEGLLHPQVAKDHHNQPFWISHRAIVVPFYMNHLQTATRNTFPLRHRVRTFHAGASITHAAGKGSSHSPLHLVDHGNHMESGQHNVLPHMTGNGGMLKHPGTF